MEQLTDQDIGKAQEMSAMFAASFLSNLQRAPEELVDKFGELNYDKVAERLLETAEANLELARFFSGEAAKTGSPAWRAFCQKWEETFLVKVELYRSQSLTSHEKVEAFVDDFNVKVSSELGFFAEGATGRKVLPFLDKTLTIADLTTALATGDWGKATGVVIGYFVGEAVAALVGTIAAGLALPATACVLLVATIGGLAGIAAGEISESIFDGLFGTPQDELLSERIGRLLSGASNSEVLPNLGYKLRYGEFSSDVIICVDDQENSVVALGGDDIVIGGLLSDYLSGGSGNDVLEGGVSGSDTLVGGVGDDTLTGGRLSDTLDGGLGVDVYKFYTHDFDGDSTEDVILDSDGHGEIRFNDLNIADSGLLGDNIFYNGLGIWRTADEQFGLWLTGEPGNQTLYIRHQDTGSRIVVKNWKSGDLGITLPEQPAPLPPPAPSLDDGLYDQSGDEVANQRVVYNDTVSGTGSNDAIDGGLGNDKIYGGDGSDLLLGGAGDNTIYGGDGNDFVFGSNLTLKFSHETGTSHYQAWYDATVASFGSSIAAWGNGWFVRTASGLPYDSSQANGGDYIFDFYVPASEEGNATSPSPNEFASGVDTVDAGIGNDFVSTSEGDDVVNGGDGNDVLLGGADNDYMRGGIGNDFILGDSTAIQGSYVSSQANSKGHDMLHGDAGDDVIMGQGGNDVIDGGADNDKLYGDGGNDNVSGGDGNDYLEGDRQSSTNPEESLEVGSDHLDGGAGNDLIHGGGGDDSLLGGTGDDQIDGDYDGGDRALDGGDLIRAGAGNDLALGGGGDDALYGEDGNDQLYGDSSGIAEAYHGNDTLYGGAGADRIWGQGGDDRLSGGLDDDTLDGGTGNDSLSGDDGDDKVYGGLGDDTLSGGYGNDIVAGGDGNDTALGDAGDDEMYGERANDRLDGGSGNDHIEGGMGNDVVSGGADNDVLFGDEGDDSLDGGLGRDTLLGDWGNDRLAGGDGDDQLDGGTDLDLLLGGNGNDALNGGEGDDVLQGEQGDDLLSGEAGNDRLIGGIGNDVLLGGGGNDVFVFDAGGGADVILGSAAVSGEVDRIELNAIDRLDAAQFTKIGNDLKIVVAESGESLYIRDFFNGRSYQLVLSGGFTYTETQIRNMEELVVVDVPQAPPAPPPTTIGNIYGSGTGAQIYGTLGADQIYGTSGNDTISGEPSSYSTYYPFLGAGDVIRPGAGNDYVAGGAGNDWIILDRGFGTDTVDLKAGGTDTIQFNFAFDPHVVIGFQRYVGLVITFGDSYDKLIITNAGPWTGTDFNLKFSDGTTLSGSELVEAAEQAFIVSYYFGHGGTYLEPSTFGGLPSFDPWFNEGNTEGIVFGQGSDNEDVAELYNFTTHLGGGSDRFSFINSGSNLIFGDDPYADRFFAGNDQIIMKSEDPTRTNYLTVFGMGGDDLIYGGTSKAWGHSDVVLSGGDGTDTLYGRPLEAVSGKVYYSTLDGGRGNDILYSGGAAVAYGGQGDDRLYGGQYWDDLIGGEGNDAAYGGGGADYIHGNDGNDWLEGGDGKDEVHGEHGNDVIDGGADDDLLTGGDGDDVIRGGTGNDTLRGEAGNNVLYGDDGNDTLWAYYGSADHLFGGAGNDTLMGFTGAPTTATLLDGGDGNDVISAGASETSEILVLGGSGDDTIRVSSSGSSAVVPKTAVIDGGAGDDYFDILNNNGSNVVRLAPGAGHDELVMRVASQTPESAVTHIEFSGVNLADVEWVREGEDLVIRYGQNDSLRVSDYFWSLGSSTFLRFGEFRFADGTVLDQYSLPTLTTNGTSEADRLIGWQSPDSISAGGGDDFVMGNSGADLLDGGDGADFLDGGDDDDVLVGGDGDDSLDGGKGSNLLDGGAGNDQLWTWDDGTPHQNTFRGGTGNDMIWGTSFGDVYIFDRGDGQDEMWEWDDSSTAAAHDVLSLGAGIAPDDIAFSRDGFDLVLTIAGGTDRIVWKEYFVAYSYPGDAAAIPSRFDEIRFADGTVWLAQDIAAKLSEDGVNSELGTRQSVGNGNVIATGTSFNDVIYGQYFNDTLYGKEGDDTLRGQHGADTLDGGVGNDLLEGGTQSDTYVLRHGSGSDQILDVAESGDTADVVRFEDVAAAEVRFIGHAGADLVIAYGTDDQVTVQGYFADAVNLIEEFRFVDGTVWTATDIQARALPMQLGTPDSDVLAGPIDASSVLDGGAGNDVLSGGGLADILFGRDGNDRLDGGGSGDDMSGGAGDDVYVLGSSDDIVRESIGEGVDRVEASISYVLGAEIEDLTLTGSDATDGMGNALANEIVGNEAANALAGGEGNDTLQGMAGNDTLTGGAGDDHLRGGDGADILIGGIGNNSFAGGSGNDELRGDLGLDTYTFSRGDGQDTIWEFGSLGYDEATATSGRSVADVVEFGTGIANSDLAAARQGDDLVLTIANSTDQITLKGWYLSNDNWIEQFAFSDGSSLTGQQVNNLVPPPEPSPTHLGTAGNDTITGSSGGDIISGLDGNDTLNGALGSDILKGGAGDDVLDGQSHNDIMEGGAGSDQYKYTPYGGGGHDLIRNFDADPASNDVLVFSLAGAGSLSFFERLGDDLKITYGTDYTVTIEDWFVGADYQLDTVKFDYGNIFSRVQINNSFKPWTEWEPTWVGTPYADNKSGAGDDMMLGEGGDDILQAGDGNDLVFGGEGNDSLYGNGPGNRRLDGGLGNDLLAGGPGSTAYVFGRGDGQDTINNNSWSSTVGADHYVLELKAGIAVSDVTLERSGDHLIVRIVGTTDSVKVYGYYAKIRNYGRYSLNEIRFADGTVWDTADIEAWFMPPATSSSVGVADVSSLSDTSLDDAPLVVHCPVDGSEAIDEVDGVGELSLIDYDIEWNPQRRSPMEGRRGDSFNRWNHDPQGYGSLWDAGASGYLDDAAPTLVNCPAELAETSQHVNRLVESLAAFDRGGLGQAHHDASRTREVPALLIMAP